MASLTGHAQAQTFFTYPVAALYFHNGRHPVHQGLGMALRGNGTIGLGLLYGQTMAVAVFLTIP